jgi:hypothetical protein
VRRRKCKTEGATGGKVLCFFADSPTRILKKKGGEYRMKKMVSREALVKEAAYWTTMKDLAKKNPGTVCHK